LLAGGFVASFAALQLFRALDYSYGNRFAFFQAFFAQALLAEAVAVGVLLVSGQEHRASLSVPRRGLSRIVFPVLAVATVALTLTTPLLRAEANAGRGLAGLRSLLGAASYHDLYYASLGVVRMHLTPDDIVLVAPGRTAFDVASITGARVVVSPFAYRVPDYAQRAQDVERFLAPGTSPFERAEILARRHVSKVLITPPHLAIATELSSLGPVVHSDAGAILIAVSSPKTTR
jgi:hypothetical protein